jgi:hypothetical protein
MPRRRSAALPFCGRGAAGEAAPGTASEAPSEAATSVVGNASPLETWPRTASSALRDDGPRPPSWSVRQRSETRFRGVERVPVSERGEVAAVNYPRRDNHEVGGLGWNETVRPGL